jgi:uncharacterized protein (TIGR02271 family)
MAYETDPAGMAATPIVIGLFNDSNDAQNAVTQLRTSGFSASQIGAAFRSRAVEPYTTSGSTASSKTESLKRDAESWWEKVKEAFRPDESTPNRREVAAASDVGVDPYGEDRYPTDEYDFEYANHDFERSLVGTGIPADRAAYLSRNFQPGGAIVTVRDTDRVEQAEQILSANHGKIRHEQTAGTEAVAAGTAASVGAIEARSAFEPVESTSANDPYGGAAGRQSPAIDAAASTGRKVTDIGAISGRVRDEEPAADATDLVDPIDQRPEASSSQSLNRVQLFGEVLRVHKDRVKRGEVRLRKDVVSEDQNIEVPVTREELVLERVDVANTPAPSANIGQGQEVRVPLTEERVRLEKQPVVREEIAVGKREVSDVARVGERVRHEELRVDADLDTPKRTVSGEPPPESTRRSG